MEEESDEDDEMELGDEFEDGNQDDDEDGMEEEEGPYEEGEEPRIIYDMDPEGAAFNDTDDEEEGDRPMNSDLDTFNMSTSVLEKPPHLTFSFSGHSQGVMSLAKNPLEPTQFISGGLDDLLAIHSLSSPAPLQTLNFPETVSLVDFSFDGKLIAAGCMDSEIRIFEKESSGNFKQKLNLQGPTDELTVS